MPDGQDDTRTETLLLLGAGGALILAFMLLTSLRRPPVACPVPTSILVRGRVSETASVFAIVADQKGGCVKRHVLSPTVMDACGYKWWWIFTIEQAVLDSIPYGPPIDGADCPPILFHYAPPPPPPSPVPAPPG